MLGHLQFHPNQLLLKATIPNIAPTKAPINAAITIVLLLLSFFIIDRLLAC
jgi:hypothetical protein